jgi:prepilin-type processing-associated H-X9-DG protein
MYNHIRTPNDPEVDCRGGLPHSNRSPHWWDRLSHNVAARSAHSNGVHVLFCDGQIRFATDDVDLDMWQAWGSRNGAEVEGN